MFVKQKTAVSVALLVWAITPLCATPPSIEKVTREVSKWILWPEERLSSPHAVK
jgi:hypothetical protein